MRLSMVGVVIKLVNSGCGLLSVDSCTYQLEKEDLVVSELFEMLDSVRDEIGIVDWGIKMTTLEDGGYSFSLLYLPN